MKITGIEGYWVSLWAGLCNFGYILQKCGVYLGVNASEEVTWDWSLNNDLVMWTLGLEYSRKRDPQMQRMEVTGFIQEQKRS